MNVLAVSGSLRAASINSAFCRAAARLAPASVRISVALVNTSSRARHAHDALREVLQTMSANILPEASITLPLLGTCITEDAMLYSPEVAQQIRRALESLARTLDTTVARGPSFPLD